ncbi:MAG: hypothetical protein IJI66_04060 [Erysipelotrichaceae bacterium]|nr:hypothetical protein [Erysipelotrichaceae bacterium]
MESIIRVKDVVTGMNVSKSTASRMVKEVIQYYGLDPKRMPIEGSCPEWAFNDYFQLIPKEVPKNVTRK